MDYKYAKSISCSCVFMPKVKYFIVAVTFSLIEHESEQPLIGEYFLLLLKINRNTYMWLNLLVKIYMYM